MVSELARRQIRAVTRQALEQAGAAGVIPTPLEEVSRVAGITETIDISQVPADLVAHVPRAWRRVLGALFYRPRILVIDRSQGTARGRFIEAHEIIHKLMPAHETIVRLDDERRIFGSLKREIEHEAELGAAELLFQGELFVRRALDFPVSLAAPLGLAPEFEASLTAAVRHYPDYHPDPVAVIVAGRYADYKGMLPIWSSHESPSFRQRFGSAAQLFPGGLPARDTGTSSVGATVSLALRYGDIAQGDVTVRDVAGEVHDMIAEAFFNQHVVILLLTERRVARRIARRVETRVV